MTVTAPTLRPYQQAALDAIEAALLKGTNRVLVKKPTGTGKTVMFAELMRKLAPWLEQLPEKHRKMLVIAHREELLDQAAAKISAANPGKMVMIEQGDRRASVFADVVVASIQTLQAMKFRRLQRFLRQNHFAIVVVDEAHHAAAATYRSALAHLGFLPKADISDSDESEAVNFDDVAVMEHALAGWDATAPKDRLLVGVTATPNRSDAIGLGCVFQSIAFSYALKQAIEDGWLVPITPWVVETDTSLDDVKLNRGDFNQRELADAVNNQRRNAMALAAWREYADGVPTIGFTVDVAHAHELAKVFADDGVRAVAISGETPKEDRRVYLRNYQEGTLDFLANCMVLTEGTDLPRTGCILHAKPTKSATLYEQMTGRGLRLYEGKTECIVIDLVDVARRHSLQTAPVLYGLPPGLLVKGKQLKAVADEFDEFLEANPGVDQFFKDGVHLTLEELRAKASTINVWAVMSTAALGQGRALEWTAAGTDDYRLTYPWADGRETLQVSKDLLGKWQVSTTLHPSDHQLPPRQRTLATDIPTAQDAAGVAEAFVLQERRSVTRIAGADADWKKRPATAKQLALLRRIKAPIPRNCTGGQAGRLISQYMARKR